MDATSERVTAVRDRFVESVRRHVSEHGPLRTMGTDTGMPSLPQRLGGGLFPLGQS